MRSQFSREMMQMSEASSNLTMSQSIRRDYVDLSSRSVCILNYCLMAELRWKRPTPPNPFSRLTVGQGLFMNKRKESSYRNGLAIPFPFFPSLFSITEKLDLISGISTSSQLILCIRGNGCWQKSTCHRRRPSGGLGSALCSKKRVPS